MSFKVNSHNFIKIKIFLKISKRENGNRYEIAYNYHYRSGMSGNEKF